MHIAGGVRDCFDLVAIHTSKDAAVALLAIGLGAVASPLRAPAERAATYGLAKLSEYLRAEQQAHFRTLKWFGMTRPSCLFAVLCGIVVWISTISVFAFITHEEFVQIVLLLASTSVLALYAVGWRFAGPRATPSRFLRAFFKPTVALAGTTIVSKFIEAGLHRLGSL